MAPRSWNISAPAAVEPVSKAQAYTDDPWSWDPGLCGMPHRLRPWWVGCSGGLVLEGQGTAATAALGMMRNCIASGSVERGIAVTQVMRMVMASAMRRRHGEGRAQEQQVPCAF